MKILLSYSRYHYDPKGKDKEKDLPLKGTSARALASTLHKILKKMGDVTYIDPLEFKDVEGLTFDLFVGQIQNFSKICKTIDCRKNILFAVNSHPKNRNEIIREFIDKNNLKIESIAPGEIVDEKDFTYSINLAESIICVGNIDVYNSYIKNGVPHEKIKMINYATGAASKNIKITKNRKRLLYTASEIGLRKGFDILEELILKNFNMDFEIDVIGEPSNIYYKKRLKILKKKFGNRLKLHGWVSSESHKYDELISKSDFIIAPSLEEGQLGAALESMSHGVVPVLTRSTGIDFSPYGFLEPKLNSLENDKVFKRIVNSPAKTVDISKLKTIEYYNEFHTEYISALEEDILSAMGDNLYPKFSIILPIHNKESTILPLIKLIDSVIKRYKNADLYIIFDGCKDRTESIVKRFFRSPKDYKVVFKKTGDIFEVKTNNKGLKAADSKYCVIVQDDNFIYDRNILFEAANFLSKSRKAVILGCLAGVNFYPKGTSLIGKGQLVQNSNETYWRQDEHTDSNYKSEFFQVDACMRGPLIIKKEFLEKHGYLDEIFAPLYMDDMDLCFRAMKHGHKNYCMLSDVDNMSLTIAKYNTKRNSLWEKVIKRNTAIFYKRWKPNISKDYTKIARTKVYDQYRPKRHYLKPRNKDLLIKKLRNIAKWRHIFNDEYSRDLSNSRWKNRMNWVISQAENTPKDAKVLDIGAGQTLYRNYFSHTSYMAQDFAQTPELHL